MIAPEAVRPGARRAADPGALASSAIIAVAVGLALLAPPAAHAQGRQSRAALADRAARAAGAAPAIVFSDSETTRCLTCHGMPNFGYWDATTRRVLSFSVQPDTFRASAHARVACRRCHTEITRYPHDLATPRTPVSCAQDCHATDSTGRAYTHARESDDFHASVHGRRPERPDPDSLTCTTCHGGGDPHAIRRMGQAATAAQKVALCGDCHDDRALMERHQVTPEATASYRRSFHYKAILFGGGRTASCPDCHTAHRILPAKDTASTVTAAHLPRTCGQENCHAGAKRNFAVSGANHLDLRIARVPLLFVEERFFLLLTAGTMLMLLAGIVLDIQRKFGWLAVLEGALARSRRAADAAGRLTLRGLRFARFILVE